MIVEKAIPKQLHDYFGQSFEAYANCNKSFLKLTQPGWVYYACLQVIYISLLHFSFLRFITKKRYNGKLRSSRHREDAIDTNQPSTSLGKFRPERKSVSGELASDQVCWWRNDSTLH